MRHLLLISVFLTTLPVFAQDAKLDQLLKALASEEQQLNARIGLRKYLESSDETTRSALLQTLITSLPSQDPIMKNRICSVLSSLNFFWTTTPQKAAEDTLYKLFQAETDPTLQATIDRALMMAKGLYREAIDDYNNDQVGPAVEAKFRRVYEDYPKSTFAPKAYFYLGLYPLRVYAILKKQNQRPNLEDYVKKSNEVLQDFLTKAAASDQILDAYYFRALNFVLLNQLDKAINELIKIENTSSSSEQKIYIYQFFYSNMLDPVTTNRLIVENDIVDKFLDANKLAKYTREYLEANKSKNFKEPSNLRQLAEKLKQFG